MRLALGWVRRAAAVLRNPKGRDATDVRRRYRRLIGAIARQRQAAGRWTEAFAPSLKVTRSYWPGLFRCDDIADRPRTNDEWEQSFGSYRYHERRASGREVACPGTVVRGSVRVVAAAATRVRRFDPADLIPSDLQVWHDLRGSLERRQAVRAPGRRFRRDPAAYLRSLEESFINQALPT